jgi:hypothetical protein
MTTLADGRWHPGIGDPNATGWITVAAYLGTAVLCACCAAREPPGGRRRRLWGGYALLLFALGINKQLDLQTWFTEIGRDIAMAHDWYADRAGVQRGFIAALAASGVVSLIGLLVASRGLGRALTAAASGLLFLVVFVVVRATSFHHVDAWLGFELGGRVRMNVALELGGIAIIAAAALARLRGAGAAPAARVATVRKRPA